MKQLDENLWTEILNRRELVRQMRAEVHAVLAQRQQERQHMSRQTRIALRTSRANTAAFAGRIRYSRRLKLETISPPLCRIPSSEATKSPQCMPAVAGATAVDIDGALVPSAAMLEQELLGTVVRHPDGITVKEIGNEMGMDWRELLGTADRLAQAGRIEQIDELFYPMGNGCS